MSELTPESEALLDALSHKGLSPDLLAMVRIQCHAIERAAAQPGRSASDGVGVEVGRLDAALQAEKVYLHWPQVERIAAALATPPPAPDGERGMESEEYRRGWDAGYGRRAADFPPTPAAAVSGAMEGMARQFGAVCRALGIDPNEADDLGTAVEEALAAAAVSVSALESPATLGSYRRFVSHVLLRYGLGYAAVETVMRGFINETALAAARDTGARGEVVHTADCASVRFPGHGGPDPAQGSPCDCGAAAGRDAP